MSQAAMEQPADGREVDPLEQARAVADAVLYEGYLLYPYRASAGKNQSRWQFGVLGPQGAAAAGTGEEPAMVSECLVRHGPGTTLTVRLRFLQLQARCVERADGVDGGDGRKGFVAVADLRDVNGQRWLSWDEAIEHEVTVATVTLQDAGSESEHPVSIEGGEEVTQLLDGEDEVGGRLVQRRWPLTAVVRVSSSSVPETTGVSRLRIEVENTAASGEPHDRTQAVRRSFLRAHLLLTCDGGNFISMTDPPADLRAATAACRQVRTWPVIAGPPGHDEVLLASQIILEDHPTVAAESPGSLFDSTEIDEILTLRILTMTEAEKAEARATDARAAEIIDRSERLTDEDMSRLHAMMRDPNAIGNALSGDALPAGTLSADTMSSETPWWGPECDASVDPATDTVLVAGTPPVASAEHGLGAVPIEGDGGVSPSDEQPAGESPEEELTHGTRSPTKAWGPAHMPGVPKGEDQASGA